MTPKNSGVYNNLLAQLDKIVKHTRQGSIKSKDRYKETFKRFCAFLADMYKLEKLANIAPKHIEDYTRFLQEKGLAASTIKTDLAGIRFYHDQISNAKYSLPDNSALNLKKQKFGGVDRRWSFAEFQKFLLLCLSKNKHDYICMAYLGYYAGLRIEECFRIDTAKARRALKTDILKVKGKNGRLRDVPIQENIKIGLKEVLERTSRGEKLFVAPNEKTHSKIASLQHFVWYNRKYFTKNRLTFHGLRHTYAKNKFEEFKSSGLNDFETREKLAPLLGHYRDDVVRIYLFKGGKLDV